MGPMDTYKGRILQEHVVVPRPKIYRAQDSRGCY